MGPSKHAGSDERYIIFEENFCIEVARPVATDPVYSLRTSGLPGNIPMAVDWKLIMVVHAVIKSFLTSYSRYLVFFSISP